MDQSARTRLVAELRSLLTEANAHVTFDEACADIPPALLTRPVPGLPHTLWQLVEHIRIAQWDIVEFSLDARHESPEWPAGYWPAPTEQVGAEQWEAALSQIRRDRDRMLALLDDPQRDLLQPLPHGQGQTLLREALLIADHTAYHTGQIILLRRQLGNWG
jgi:uncharacterized damage-inducible protein DinB